MSDNPRDPHPFSCMVGTREVTGTVRRVSGFLSDYIVVVESLRMTFTMILVSTNPQLFSINKIEYTPDCAPPRYCESSRWLGPGPRKEAPEAFAYGIEECVNWYELSEMVMVTVVAGG